MIVHVATTYVTASKKATVALGGIFGGYSDGNATGGRAAVGNT